MPCIIIIEAMWAMMTLESSVFNTLVADEICLVRSMRQFLVKDEQNSLALPSYTDLRAVEFSIRRLLKLLWENDPFLLDLCRPGDPNVSVFELQLLYAIAAR